MAWSLRSLTALNETQFAQWGKLLEERTGIQLMFQQKAWLESQMSTRMRELGIEDYDSYYAFVSGASDQTQLNSKLEWARLIDRIAVKETSFFRHRESFEYLRQYLQKKINNQSLKDSFDVWSLGCATGEEPYSLAMVINDCFELAALDPYYGITAMDISSSALKAGRKARYSSRRIAQVTPEESKRYLQQCADGSFEVIGKLRDRVCFTQANIVQARQLPQVQVDVIFCQNLLVYFRRWLRRDVLNTLVNRLKPGGLLIVGLGETVDWENPKMQRTNDVQVQAYICVKQE